MSMFLFMIGCSQAKLTLIEQDDFSHSTWMALFAVIACFYMVVATLCCDEDASRLIVKQTFALESPRVPLLVQCHHHRDRSVYLLVCYP